MEFVLSELCEQVMTAYAGHKPLFICGGGTKAFYGNRHRTEVDGHSRLDITAYRGVVDYQPSELVVTVRAGTPLAELEALLADEGQMLAFEPPHYGPGATVGGCVAAGLAGPRRVAAGGVRDFVLGTKLLDANGRLLSFGGEVMKNVAGYDVSRLLAGSLGIFGAIMEVSLKVAPRPLAELTLCTRVSEAQALDSFGQWRSRPLPISATAWVPEAGSRLGCLWVRVSGAEPAIQAARQAIGGDAVDDGQALAVGVRAVAGRDERGQGLAHERDDRRAVPRPAGVVRRVGPARGRAQDRRCSHGSSSFVDTSNSTIAAT